MWGTKSSTRLKVNIALHISTETEEVWCQLRARDNFTHICYKEKIVWTLNTYRAHSI